MKWDFIVDIKKFLNEEQPLLEVGANIRKAFQQHPIFGKSPDSFDSLFFILDRLCETDDVEDFDMWLEDLYDWADYNKVWLGI